MRAALALGLLATGAQADPATCIWFRVSPDAYYEGPCDVTWDARGMVATFEARRIEVRERGRQGQWAAVSINGVEGTRFEIDRESYAHATRDLNEFLDVRLGGGLSGGAAGP